MVCMHIPRMDDARCEVPNGKMLVYEIMGEPVLVLPGTRVLEEEYNPEKFYDFDSAKATIIERGLIVPEGTVVDCDSGDGTKLFYQHGQFVPLAHLLAGRVTCKWPE